MSGLRLSRYLQAASKHRLMSTTARRYALPFNSGPAPPRLPDEEQKRFEELQRASTGAFSTPRSPPQVNQSPTSSSPGRTSPQSAGETIDANDGNPTVKPKVNADGKGSELHPNIRRGAAPEFEGEINPKTGEVGGPKNEPLRWKGDWAYNGRVTDF